MPASCSSRRIAARFLGRGRGIRSPSAHRGTPTAFEHRRARSWIPSSAFRRRVHVAPGSTVRVHLALLVADSRERALTLADKYREPATFDRVASLAWTQAQVQLRHLGITADEAHLFQRLATRILFSDPTLRAPVETLRAQPQGTFRPMATWNLRRPADRSRSDRPGRGPGHRAPASARPRILGIEGPERGPGHHQRRKQPHTLRSSARRSSPSSAPGPGGLRCPGVSDGRGVRTPRRRALRRGA